MAVQDNVDQVGSIASRLVYELLGRRWVWPAVTTTEEVELPVGQRFVSLAGRPVTSVASVTTNLDPATQVDYVLQNGYRLALSLPGPGYGYLDAGPYWVPFPYTGLCSVPRWVTVTYTYGSAPPAGVQLAIDVLADQLRLLMDGSDDCKLPERVKTVSRQGISMDVVSPMDFLDDGRTGIVEVDEMLMTFNPSKARRPARVVSQVNPPPRRSGTTQASS